MGPIDRGWSLVLHNLPAPERAEVIREAQGVCKRVGGVQFVVGRLRRFGSSATPLGRDFASGYAPVLWRSCPRRMGDIYSCTFVTAVAIGGGQGNGSEERPMTFYRGLVEDVFDTLGRDDTLRHAYRLYLWRRALRFVHPSRSDMEPIPGAELFSEIQALLWSRRSSYLNAERVRRM